MATFAGQKILIVEDEVMIAEYLAHELRENGATVLIALSHARWACEIRRARPVDCRRRSQAAQPDHHRNLCQT